MFNGANICANICCLNIVLVVLIVWQRTRLLLVYIRVPVCTFVHYIKNRVDLVYFLSIQFVQVTTGISEHPRSEFDIRIEKQYTYISMFYSVSSNEILVFQNYSRIYKITRIFVIFSTLSLEYH